MKKTIVRIISALVISALSLTFLTQNAFAEGAYNTCNWYVRNNVEHKRPELDGELSVINGKRAVYLGPDEKVIYLTFDAGYENGNVEKILDVLKAHNAKGAFFILENLVLRNTELVKRMADEGHTVCNHTARHKNMSLVHDEAEFAAELERMEKVYNEKTGRELSKFYRPPEGAFSEANLDFAAKLGYSTVFWSFAYADWDNNKQMSGDKAIEKIMKHIHNGEIMLLHPTSATNAAILDEVLTRLEADGWRFGTLDELCTEAGQ